MIDSSSIGIVWSGLSKQDNDIMTHFGFLTEND